MGYWTQWFVAERAEADAIAAMSEDENTHTSIILDNVIQSDLDVLGEVIGVDYTDYDPLVMSPMVIQVSPAFVTAAAEIEGAAISELGIRWAKGVDILTPEEAATNLRSIVGLCKDALAEGKSVLELAA